MKSLTVGLLVWMAFPVCWLVWFYSANRPWGRAAVYATLGEMSVIGLIVGAVAAFVSRKF
jgi:hypothetical protein